MASPTLERIEVLTEKVDAVHADLRVWNARCEHCRKVVLGNGKPAISDRVSILEISRAVHDKALVTFVGIIASVVGALASTLATLLTRWVFV